MALNFPDSPSDGQKYTDTTMGETWTYEASTNSWTSDGVTTSAGIIYKGGIDVTATPPAGVASGWQYTVTTGGTPDAGFTGLTGTISTGSSILYDGTNWQQSGGGGGGGGGTLWNRSGLDLSPTNAGDSVFTTGEVKLGGTAATPNIAVNGNGEILANSGEIALKTVGGEPISFVTRNLERARIDSIGRLLVGTTSSTKNASIVCEGNSGSGTGQAIVYLNRGNTPGAANQNLGYINFANVTYGIGAQVRADSDGAWSTTSHPGRLVFTTTASGATTQTERLRITSAGLVGINEDTPTATLHVNGTTKFEGDSTFTSSKVKVEGGSFTLEANTRFFQDVGFPAGTTSKTFDLNKGNVFGMITVNTAQSWAFTNLPPVGYRYTLTIYYNLMSGPITFPGGVMWEGGTTPTINPGKGYFTFTTIDGGVTWFGDVRQGFS